MPKKGRTYPEVFQKYFEVSKSELDKAFDNLEDFYKKHSMLEYIRMQQELKHYYPIIYQQLLQTEVCQ